MTKDITNDKDFKEWILDSKEVSVVDFWAKWCGPCMVMAPIFLEVEKDISSAKFYKINLDEYSEMAVRYKIFSIPSFIIFKNGKEISKRQGGGSKDDMVKWINDNI